MFVTPPRLSPAAATALAAALAAVPFLLPTEAHLWRAIATGYAIALAMKLRHLVDGADADADPAMVATPARLLLWLSVPQDTLWPRSPAEAAAVRRTAPGLLARACVQTGLMLAVVLFKSRLLPVPLLALAALEMVQFYLLLGALADGLAGLVALGGVHCEPAFHHPAAARSPGEFWSRRWNLVVHRFAHRYVFLPAAHWRGPTLALVLTFAASGLMHEYLAIASVGPARYRPGFMLCFFLLQALAVLVTIRWRRRRRSPLPAPLTVAAHLAWLLATTPLFFHPLRPQITAFDTACLRLLGRVVP